MTMVVVVELEFFHFFFAACKSCFIVFDSKWMVTHTTKIKLAKSVLFPYRLIPANIYLFQSTIKTLGKRYEICSKLRNTLKKEKPQVFHELFIILNQNHTYNPRAATYHFFDIPQAKTIHFGNYSVKIWNKV